MKWLLALTKGDATDNAPSANRSLENITTFRYR